MEDKERDELKKEEQTAPSQDSKEDEYEKICYVCRRARPVP